MGDPRRFKRKYATPSNSFQRARLAEEIRYIGRYGLRNKREFWRHKTQLSNFRNLARAARASSEPIQSAKIAELRNSLVGYGFVTKDAKIDDILGLSVDQFLDRRLQTIVFKKGLARSIHQARQMVVHGHIAVAGRLQDTPSYLVTVKEESQIEYAVNSPFRVDNKLVWGEEAPQTVKDIGQAELDLVNKEKAKNKDRQHKGGDRRRGGGGRPQGRGRPGQDRQGAPSSKPPFKKTTAAPSTTENTAESKPADSKKEE